MTDQPHGPGAPGNSGAWQPVPGGGDYDPDQTMHVSFAAQLPPEPLPGEDPLGAHGPAGPGGAPAPPGPADAVTQWSIPVIRDEPEADSGQYPLRSAPSPWEQAPPSGATQSFPAGMFGQGAAAAQAAQAEAAALGRSAGQAQSGHARAAAPPPGAPPGGEHLTGQWAMPFSGPEAADAAPWLPASPPAADTAWSTAVDDPDRPLDPPPYASPGRGRDTDPDAGRSRDAHPADSAALFPAPHAEPAPDDGPQPAPAGLDALDRLDILDGLDALPGLEGLGAAGPLDPPATGPAADPGPGGHLDGRPDGHPDSAPGAGDQAGADPATDPATDRATHPVVDAAPAAEAAAEAGTEAVTEPEPLPQTRSEHPLASYMLRVNGTERPVTDAWLGESLLYVLRERLGLAGAKDGCEQGECGACSVQVDGRLVASCLVPAATAAGSEVRTVEGLTVDGRPSDVQCALAESGAVQCGFCIPGMAMTVHDLLEGNHKPTDLDIRQALSGNLCRCSGYRGVIDAVREVVATRDTDDDPAFSDEARVPHQGGPGPQGGAA